MALKPRTWSVTIMQGDDLERLRELDGDVEVAKFNAKRGNARGGGGAGGSVTAAEERRSAFIREAVERSVEIQGRALGNRKWRDLLAQHRPRIERRLIDGAETEVTHPDDSAFGVNTITFPEALLRFVDSERPEVRTITAVSDPDLSLSDLSWLDDLPGGEYDRLWATAYHFNTASGADPKALMTSPESSLTSG